MGSSEEFLSKKNADTAEPLEDLRRTAQEKIPEYLRKTYHRFFIPFFSIQGGRPNYCKKIISLMEAANNLDP